LSPQPANLESKPCPLGCAPSDTLEIVGEDRLNGCPGSFRLVRCNACNLLRVDPRPDQISISDYYPETYAPYDPISDRQIHQSSGLGAWLGLHGRQLPPMPRGRMLEVGCATGDFLAHSRKCGWAVHGIEFSEVAAGVAQSRGLSVEVCSIESATSPSEPYDLIVAWMVLEHLHEPVRALRHLRSWLAPEGYLVGSIPDAEAVERRVFGKAWYALQLPTHLFHYTPSTLRRVLAAAGWELIRVKWQANSTNLLLSLSYKLEDWGMERAARAVATAVRAKQMRWLTVGLGWILALVRQSGRLEFWARPAANAS
jgi:2-polyprenyl-3-methyl-5-hydroxy-6-metoxy-1,4-benzoquinol methylase